MVQINFGPLRLHPILKIILQLIRMTPSSNWSETDSVVGGFHLNPSCPIQHNIATHHAQLLFVSMEYPLNYDTPQLKHSCQIGRLV